MAMEAAVMVMVPYPAAVHLHPVLYRGNVVDGVSGRRRVLRRSGQPNNPKNDEDRHINHLDFSITFKFGCQNKAAVKVVVVSTS